jgi:S1-C subfamily serine protease
VLLSRLRSASILAAVACVALLAAACGSSSSSSSTPTAASTSGGGGGGGSTATTTSTSGQTTSGQSAVLPSLRDVVKKITPSVVQVTNNQVQYNQFNQQQTVPAGVGSGVIYDKDGHIITNNHVVAGASGLVVALPDGRSFDAKLVGADPASDLAVLQISGQNLPVATLGDSSKLAPGDWTIAVGNALALPGGPTVTTGVVSALGRTTAEPGSGNQAGPVLFGLIQTDAPINPGNSGGALTDINGNVIGINTLVAGEAEPGVQAQNIGFAININTAKSIAGQLVANGKVDHAYLGVSYIPLTPAIAQQLGTTEKDGMVVGEVAPGSPAAVAGIQPRDILTKFDGKPLDSESALAEGLAAHKPGDKVSITYSRNGQSQDVSLTLGTAPQGN